MLYTLRSAYSKPFNIHKTIIIFDLWSHIYEVGFEVRVIVNNDKISFDKHIKPLIGMVGTINGWDRVFCEIKGVAI